jgi:hypothetical protein
MPISMAVLPADDLILVFQAGTYEDTVDGNATWASGDWTGDREFNSEDLIAAFQDGGYETGPRPSVAAVPEPNTALMAIVSLVSIIAVVRRRSNWEAAAAAVGSR